MTDFSVIEAKSWHCGEMSRLLRDEQADALCRFGVNVHRKLRAMFEESPFRKAWMIDGRVAGLGGVSGTMAESDGFVWLALSKGARLYRREMVREARRQIDTLLQTYRSLHTTILVSDAPSVRFAQHLGFRPVPLGSSKGVVTMRLGEDSVAEAPRPFLVFGLPRSRTAWLAHWLGGCHDLSAQIETISELKDILSETGAGTVETWLGHAWPLLLSWFPKARFVVVRRPIAEVAASLERAGMDIPTAELEERQRHLDEISTLPRALCVDFADLDDEAVARRLWQHCRDEPFDIENWRTLRGRNIQIDTRTWAEDMERRAPAMTSLFYQILAKTQPVTIGAEPFDVFWRDAQVALDEHRREAGAMAGMPFDPNVEVARALDGMGKLVTIVARCAGIVVGYIMFSIGPSLESRNVLMGTQGPWFVLKPFRGALGLRLHAHARSALAGMGIAGLTMRSGVRATGPRHFKLYERLGAIDMGRLYHLPMGG